MDEYFLISCGLIMIMQSFAKPAERLLEGLQQLLVVSLAEGMGIETDHRPSAERVPHPSVCGQKIRYL